MKAFFNLSQRRQIIRLRKLANTALRRYDIGEISLRFLSTQIIVMSQNLQWFCHHLLEQPLIWDRSDVLE